MRSIVALMRAQWLSMTSYRLRIIMSFAALLLSVIPIYFVANALQPLMEPSISQEAEQYFAFVLVGTVIFSAVGMAVSTLPGQITSGITTGTLEALLATRTGLPRILLGVSSFSVFWSGVRGVVALGAGWLLGAHFAWSNALPALLIALLIVAATVPFGIMAAAMVLAFRTPGPLPSAVLFLFGALGGVYYPTQVIPGWIERVSDWVPLTYGLRALRRVFIRGDSLAEVSGDLGILVVFTVVLFVLAWIAFVFAFRYARRAGTLTQY